MLEYFILFIVLLGGVIIAFNVFNNKKTTKTKKAIHDCLSEFGSVSIFKDQAYDFKLDTKETVYLFKTIYNYDRKEISLNSKNFWVKNNAVVSSKNSGVRIENIYDLVNKNDFDFKKPVKKIYIIYPSSRTLLKTINESEVVFIKPELDCFGVKVTNFTDIVRDFDKF